MKHTLFVLDFIYWYYTRAFRDIVAVWSNLAWFIIHFFSIPLLLRTFFAPWKRIHESYKVSSMEGFFEALVMNGMSRMIGILIRLFFIIMGVLTLLVAVIGLFVFVVGWVFMPLITVVSMIYGVIVFFL